MAISKAKIFNLAAGALLLQKQISDPDGDQSNVAAVLRTWYDIALLAALEEMDLDSTVEQITLELIETDPVDEWLYVYKYPARCALLRRIKSFELTDNRTTQIPKRVGMWDNQKAIFTNEYQAIGECIVNDFPLSALTSNAALAVSYKLASMCAPLIVGKGAARLAKIIDEKYMIAKAQAMEQDRRENFNFVDESIDSEFVEARLE